MTANHNILLINQDKAFREQITPVLQAAGYTVHAATEMRNALSALSTHPMGLIVCDKELDDIGGYEFLSFIKKDPLRENIPVMFLVPLKNQGRPFMAFKLGAVDYLVYPLDSKTLIDRIKEVFQPATEETISPRPENGLPWKRCAWRSPETVSSGCQAR